MAVYGTQNTIHASIESRSACARSFRYPGRGKNCGRVITRVGFMLGLEGCGDFISLVPQSYENLRYSGSGYADSLTKSALASIPLVPIKACHHIAALPAVLFAPNQPLAK